MSMHKIPLTPIEETGLRTHGLAIGTPSQLSDVFRQGVAWAQREAVAAYKAELFQKYESSTERATEAGGDAFTHGYLCGESEAVAVAVPEWLPIETAPKNCRILIGRVGHPWAVSARWNERKEYWSTGQTPMDFFAKPTHWMPLPPPPEVKP